MDKSLIIQALRKWNMWDSSIDIGISRQEYLNRIYPFMSTKEVIILQGIRRSGKSTIVKQLMHELINNDISPLQILYVNLEDFNFAPFLKIELLEEILNAYKAHTKNTEKIYLFIDEVQKIVGWEKWVRTYYDQNQNIKFILTGSSSEIMARESSTSMTGRNIMFTIRPLSYKECCSFSGTNSIQDYMQYGGFPEVVLQPSETKKNALLRQYLNDILYKDVIAKHNVRNAKQLITVATYLVGTAGGKVSVNKLSRVLGISQKAVSQYISYLLEAYLLYEVPWFSYSLKTRHDASKLSKFYCLDNGLINISNVKYTQNRGQMFENTVLIHLAQRYNEVHYWSSPQAEVDFIFEKSAINVTATDDIPEREWRGLNEFSKKHKNFSCTIVSASTTSENVVPLRKFLTELY